MPATAAPYDGLTPNFMGLYQFNVVAPAVTRRRVSAWVTGDVLVCAFQHVWKKDTIWKA
jgi:uncharacterized protein (TIGR03437 family)